MGDDRVRAQRTDLESALELEEREKARRRQEAAGWPGKRSLVVSALEQSSGSTLPMPLQRSLERALGEPLGEVRVHVDGSAARAAAGLDAKAFTIGQAVYFGTGQFDPASKRGRELIAHEVAHTVQQRGAARRANVSVARPGDAFERQAESFADAFSSGRRAPVVSRGAVGRAVIQRDLLDGAAPTAQPEPIHVPGTQPDLLSQLRGAIHEARERGGSPAVVAFARNLRSQATPTTATAIEQAIAGGCNAQEKQQLGAGTVTPGGQAGPAGHDPAHANPGPTPRDAQVTGGRTAEVPTIGPAPHDAAPQHAAAPQNGAAPQNAAAQNAAPQNGASQTGGQNAGPAHAAPAHAGPEHAGPEHAGPQSGAAQHGGAHAAPQTEAHAGGEAEPAHEIPEANGRALIEQELSFHEQWAAFAEQGAAGRAGHLLAGMVRGENGSMMSGDLALGGRGALLQFGGGLATKLLATRTPLSRIPGAGNIIGGALSAYSLFSHGGAGIRSLGTEIGHGIGGAFSAANWRESPWLTAANLVAGIKAVLELIGNVCNILSGLAYAFAAIAAVGGLLSVLFPPLAFLVPYIPAAINFGRACGGIATICITAANVLSPIPPILRAIHLIFSTNDPIRLVGEEHKYHEEVQGALAAYGSAKLGQVAEHGRAGITRSVTGDRMTAMGEATHAYRGAMGGGVLPTPRNMSAGVTNTREALGMNDQTRSGAQAGRGYFNPEEQTTRNEGRLDRERDRLASEERDNKYVQQRADRAVDVRDANPTPQNVRAANNLAATAERHEAQVAHQEHRVEMVEQQTQIPSGRSGEEIGGESGDMTDNAFKRNRETANEGAEDRGREQATDAYHELREGQPAAHAEHNAEGHVVLPASPGNLQQVDALDQQIEQLRHAQQEVRAHTQAAHVVEHDAGVQAQGLQAAQQGVTAHVQQNVQRGAAADTQITGQNTEMVARTSQANEQSSGSAGQASGALTAIAGTARTVDGLLLRIPSNRFFDVGSSQRNVHNFVVGMDQVTGAGTQQVRQHQQATTAIAQRTQQQGDARQLNAQATGTAQQLVATMAADAQTAQTARGAARGVAAEGQNEQQQIAQQLATAQDQRRTKWQQLLSWAAQHRALREAATANEHHS